MTLTRSSLAGCASALLLACVVSLVAAGGASAQSASASGVRTTRQLPGVPCSVTSAMAVNSSTRTMSYGGGVSCAGGAGQKTLDVVPQVYGVVKGHGRWYTLGGFGRYQGPTPINPLRLSASRTAVPGHLYRLLVYAAVTLSGGRASSQTACAGCTGATPRLFDHWRGWYQAAGAGTVTLPGVPCWAGDEGLNYAVVNGTYLVDYAGWADCRSVVSRTRMSLAIAVQIANRRNGHVTWYTIAGSGLRTGMQPGDSLYLRTARSAFIGRAYRIVVSVQVRYAGAHGVITSTAVTRTAGAAP